MADIHNCLQRPQDLYGEHLRADARHIFHVPSLRRKQEEAITRIVQDPRCGEKLIVVNQTGGGISHTLSHRVLRRRNFADNSATAFAHHESHGEN